MTAETNKETSPGGKEPVMTEKIARGRVLLIEGGKDGIVALDRSVRELEKRARALRSKRDTQRVTIENMKASRFFGGAKAFWGGAQAGLAAIEEELEPITEEIRGKSAKVYRGIIEIDNIIDQFMASDRQYKIADVVQVSLGKVKMMAVLYLRFIHNAQIKVEGALNAGAGEEAAQMIGTDITLYTEKYNKDASAAIGAVKHNAEGLHKALREYSSNLESATEWNVSIAIDANSVFSVDLLTSPHFMDVYTPKNLEDLKVQLQMLKEATDSVIEQVGAGYKELQDKKNGYIITRKKKICDHLFSDEDRTYHKERAKQTWTGEEKLFLGGQERNQGTDIAPVDDMIE